MDDPAIVIGAVLSRLASKQSRASQHLLGAHARIDARELERLVEPLDGPQAERGVAEGAGRFVTVSASMMALLEDRIFATSGSMRPEM